MVKIKFNSAKTEHKNEFMIINDGEIDCSIKVFKEIAEEYQKDFVPMKYTPNREYTFAVDIIEMLGEGEILYFDETEFDPNVIY